MAGTSETPGPPTGPDDINSRLAEIAAELASEARFKEPSAAERARARVTANRPAAGKARRGPFRRLRARHKTEELRRPLQVAGAPDAPPRPSRRARRAASRAAADRGYADATTPSALRSGTTIAIIMALLIGVSVGLRYAIRHVGAAAPRATVSTRPTASPAGPVPTTPPASAAAAGSAPAFDPAMPFAGTPAANWAVGPAGIVAPPAVRHGTFPAAQVAAADATVRELLIAGYLNPQTLYGGRPTAFAALLDTREHAWILKNLNRTGLSRTGDELSTRAWVNSFAPGSADLVGTVIAVHGSMSAVAARYAGRAALRVRTDYLFVYPVQKPGDAASGMRVVTRVVMTVYFGPWNEPASSQVVAHVATIAGGSAGVLCGSHDGYVHPAFAAGPGTGPGPSGQPTGQPVSPYDQRTPPSAIGECVPTTGT